MTTTWTMNAAQLTQRLVQLEQEFRQYRVEMALKVDKLERLLEDRLEEAQRNHRRVPPRADVGRSYTSHLPGFSEHRSDFRAPSTINATSGFGSVPAPSYSPFVNNPTYSRASYDATYYSSSGGTRSSRNVGSGQNAAYLPYAIEKVAAASQSKTKGDRRACTCGRPAFEMKCFREHHFDWCRLHQRVIVSGRHKCAGNDNRDCQPVRWEKHPDWERIVKGSFDSGELGLKNVSDLYELLFPFEEYPDKYDNGWYVG